MTNWVIILSGIRLMMTDGSTHIRHLFGARPVGHH